MHNQGRECTLLSGKEYYEMSVMSHSTITNSSLREGDGPTENGFIICLDDAMLSLPFELSLKDTGDMGGWTCVYRGSRVSVDRALICPCHTVGHTVGSVWIMPLSAG